MVGLVENGKCFKWTQERAEGDGENGQAGSVLERQPGEEWDGAEALTMMSGSTWWEQFVILYNRRTLQMIRDSVSGIVALR